MGFRKPRLGKDIRMGTPTDALELYSRYYLMFARCRRPSCEHRREIPFALLLKAFSPKATLAEVGARFRCHKCGMRGARIESEFIGPTTDGR